MRSLDLSWERSKVLENWKEWAIKIDDATKKVLSKNLLGTYIFGSVVKGKLVACSDIDILIVARNIPKSFIKRSEIKEEIIRKSNLPLIHPFEIHLVDDEEAKIYFKHIGNDFFKIDDLRHDVDASD